MNKKIENTNVFLNNKMEKYTKKYYNPGMGTENMSFILHSLIKFTRPKVILEFGAGLSTFFILEALKDNINDTTLADHEFKLIVKQTEDEEFFTTYSHSDFVRHFEVKICSNSCRLWKFFSGCFLEGVLEWFWECLG